MRRFIKSSKDDVQTYQNRRNPNKYMEVKEYDDGHMYSRQYMKWDTPEGEVKNYNGSKTNRGRYSRTSGKTLDSQLRDYENITKTYEAKFLDGDGKNAEYRYHYVKAPNDKEARKLAEKIQKKNGYNKCIYVAQETSTVESSENLYTDYPLDYDDVFGAPYSEWSDSELMKEYRRTFEDEVADELEYRGFEYDDFNGRWVRPNI